MYPLKNAYFIFEFLLTFNSTSSLYFLKDMRGLSYWIFWFSSNPLSASHVFIDMCFSIALVKTTQHIDINRLDFNIYTFFLFRHYFLVLAYYLKSCLLFWSKFCFGYTLNLSRSISKSIHNFNGPFLIWRQ